MIGRRHRRLPRRRRRTRCCRWSRTCSWSLPALPLLIIVLGYLPPDTGRSPTILVLSVLGWPWGARVIRAQTLALRGRDFVAAARETGERTLADHRVRDGAERGQPDRRELRRHGAVRDRRPRWRWPSSASPNLNSWSLGTMLYWAREPAGPSARRLVVVRAAGPGGRALGTEPRAAELRHRRARQPAPARRGQPAGSTASGCSPTDPTPVVGPTPRAAAAQPGRVRRLVLPHARCPTSPRSASASGPWSRTATAAGDSTRPRHDPAARRRRRSRCSRSGTSRSSTARRR